LNSGEERRAFLLRMAELHGRMPVRFCAAEFVVYVVVIAGAKMLLMPRVGFWWVLVISLICVAADSIALTVVRQRMK
jgi:hypothetical protein